MTVPPRVPWEAFAVALVFAVAMAFSVGDATIGVGMVAGAALALGLAGSAATELRSRRRARQRTDASMDVVTGFRNRAEIIRATRDALAVADPLGGAEQVAIISVAVRDAAGLRDALSDDALLQLQLLVAARLSASVREDDILARVDDLSFAVLLRSPAPLEDGQAVASRITCAFDEPMSVDGRDHVIALSIGLAVAADVGPGDPRVRAERLLHNGVVAADAHGQARHGASVYNPAAQARVRDRLELGTDLRRAIVTGELALYYQPLVDLTTGLPTGYEALVRWRHPERGLLSPAEFIPVAENSGLVVAMGGWVLREACRQIAEWQPLWNDMRYVSVNVAAEQITEGVLIDQVHAALADSGVLPSQLLLEATESSMMRDLDEAERIMRTVQRLGVRWAVDDFGTGYSSLSYLRRFPVQVLKIDKAFVDHITDDDTGGPLVDGIIGMARNLRMTVVAEGIETAEQGMRVRGMGGDVGQGYLFGRPVPPGEIPGLGRSSALPTLVAGR